MSDLEATPDMSGEFWDQHGYKSREEWGENYEFLAKKVNIMNEKLQGYKVTDIRLVFDGEMIPYYKRITLMNRMIDSMCIEFAEAVANGKFPEFKHILDQQ